MSEIYGPKRHNGRPQDAIGKKRLEELQVAAEAKKPPERDAVTQALIEIIRENGRAEVEGEGGGVERREGE
jgi:hypothetical protein